MSLVKRCRCHRSAAGLEKEHDAQLSKDVPESESPSGVLGTNGSMVNQMVTQAASAAERLGPPMNIDGAATLLGCSTWMIRNRLIPRGLPHFRISQAGKLIFYRNQLIRWIEKQQRIGSI